MHKFALATVIAFTTLLTVAATGQAADPYSLRSGYGYGSSNYHDNYRGSSYDNRYRNGGTWNNDRYYGSSYASRYDYDRDSNFPSRYSGSSYGQKSYVNWHTNDRDCHPNSSWSGNSGWSGYGSASSYNHHHHSPSRW